MKKVLSVLLIVQMVLHKELKHSNNSRKPAHYLVRFRLLTKSIFMDDLVHKDRLFIMDYRFFNIFCSESQYYRYV